VRSVFVRPMRSLQRNILAGLITVGPLFVTWLVFSFLLEKLERAGQPLVYGLQTMFAEAWLRQPWMQSVLAVALTLLVLYVLGKLTSLVIGRQAFGLFESMLERLPVVAKVYTSVRQLLDTMMAKKDSTQRVVLVDFPIAGQKSIGFLTRTMVDANTGEELAAVLLPNAINPTSAFLQLMPMSRVTLTDLSMEQAMSMLLTGGAVAPERIVFSREREAALAKTVQGSAWIIVPALAAKSAARMGHPPLQSLSAFAYLSRPIAVGAVMMDLLNLTGEVSI
jgi:uncharacterized membrane protein